MKDKTLYLNSSFETKAVKKGSKSLKIAGYANTITKDRAGDVVTAEAWAKGVENYRRNPVLLYQHKHDSPIGRVDKITVDKKGIFVEAAVSEAAERNQGIQTLIRDGALKSFSVGFRVKDGKYNREDDSMMITDVELMEISVVSVPCNQDSLFSIRKSFESDSDFEEFKKSFEPASEDEVKMMRSIKARITNVNDGHYHTVQMDKKSIQNYVAKTENIKGETTTKELPPYLQDVIKQRLQKGLTIPNIPLSKLNLSKTEMEAFGPISEEKGNAAVTKIIDPNVDLTDATGFLSSLKSGMRFLAGQASEIGVGSGDVFKETSAGRKMLNALANATERFIAEAAKGKLDVQSLARLQKELVRPSGLRTDADALSQLEVTRSVMQKTREELQDIIDNPKKYRDVSLDKARKAITFTSGLIDEYGTAINSYKRFGGFREQGGGSEQLFKNIIKKRKTN